MAFPKHAVIVHDAEGVGHVRLQCSEGGGSIEIPLTADEEKVLKAVENQQALHSAITKAAQAGCDLVVADVGTEIPSLFRKLREKLQES